MKKVQYQVKSGKNTGIILTPHFYEGGYYLAHKTNSRNDPGGIRVKTESELIDLVERGYHVRMSNLEYKHPSSTVKPEIIE